MMGPVEFLVLTFPEMSPGDGALRALAGLRLSGAVRVIDTLIVAKDADGEVGTRELTEIPEFAYVAQAGPAGEHNETGQARREVGSGPLSRNCCKHHSQL
jgi:hypothetical protein